MSKTTPAADKSGLDIQNATIAADGCSGVMSTRFGVVRWYVQPSLINLIAERGIEGTSGKVVIAKAKSSEFLMAIGEGSFYHAELLWEAHGRHATEFSAPIASKSEKAEPQEGFTIQGGWFRYDDGVTVDGESRSFGPFKDHFFAESLNDTHGAVAALIMAVLPKKLSAEP